MGLKPLIGISSSQENTESTSAYTTNKMYIKGVAAAGGIPVIVPITEDKNLLQDITGRLSGLLLTGGDDIDPLLFGEEPHRNLRKIDPQRDFFELELTRIFRDAGKPILGICRGCQIINIAFGGTIFQDIKGQISDITYKHWQEAPLWYPTHSVYIEADTDLENIYGSGKFSINSYHHQSIKDVAPGFIVNARAEDGIIEGIEFSQDFMLGVQWHPERLWQNNKNNFNLFKYFITAASN